MVSNQLEYEWLTDIFLFMQGGPSHIDRFDPKPLVARLDGQPLPPSARSGLQFAIHENGRRHPRLQTDVHPVRPVGT